MSLDRNEFFRQVARRICGRLPRIMHETQSCLMQASDEPGGDASDGEIKAAEKLGRAVSWSRWWSCDRPCQMVDVPQAHSQGSHGPPC
jgi:hypothetical protein